MVYFRFSVENLNPEVSLKRKHLLLLEWSKALKLEKIGKSGPALTRVVKLFKTRKDLKKRGPTLTRMVKIF